MRSGDNKEFKSQNESLGHSASELVERVIDRKQLVLLKFNLEYFKKLKDEGLAVLAFESDFIKNAVEIECYLLKLKLNVAKQFTLKELKNALQTVALEKYPDKESKEEACKAANHACEMILKLIENAKPAAQVLEDFIQAEKKRITALAESNKVSEESKIEIDLMSSSLENELAVKQQASRLVYDAKYKSTQKMNDASIAAFKSEYEQVIKMGKWWKFGNFLKDNSHLDNEKLLKKIVEKSKARPNSRTAVAWCKVTHLAHHVHLMNGLFVEDKVNVEKIDEIERNIKQLEVGVKQNRDQSNALGFVIVKTKEEMQRIKNSIDHLELEQAKRLKLFSKPNAVEEHKSDVATSSSLPPAPVTRIDFSSLQRRYGSGVNEIKDKELEDGMKAFKMIYTALRAAQTNVLGFKTNFLKCKSALSAEELNNKLQVHVAKNPRGRAAEALKLVEKYGSQPHPDFSENNLDLMTDIFKFGYEKSGIRVSNVSKSFFKNKEAKLTAEDMVYAKTHPSSARGKMLVAFQISSI
ncbi:MAG: hypothetical protein P4M12_11575 [Gammaproteobacteria bacterium]|nr:hypothetical protein [Gammaproteobacteria bacterium]